MNSIPLSAVYVFAIALLTFPGFQQPHPCDVTQPSQLSVPSDRVVELAWCQPPKKQTDGSMVPVHGFAILWNGNEMDMKIGTSMGPQIAVPVGNPSPSSGMQEYRSTFFFSAGTHRLEFSAYNVVNGVKQSSTPPHVVTVTAMSQPLPVDCVVSAWSEWSAWAPITATTMIRTRTRTVVTQPANGGVACPPLTDSETAPIPAEVCGDQIDNDFDGQIDEGCQPVDCAVSAWVCTSTEWSACSAEGSQTRELTCTRTIVTQPSNGGAACPALTETRTDTQSCTPSSPDTQPPTIKAVNVARSGKSHNYTVTVAATDNVGVVGVSILLNGQAVASMNATGVSSPYVFGIQIRASGTHTVAAAVTDAAGLTTTVGVKVIR